MSFGFINRNLKNIIDNSITCWVQITRLKCEDGQYGSLEKD